MQGNEPTEALTVKESASYLPTSPGVYVMKSKNGRVIYVGKAKNLRNRVRSYFAGEKDPKTAVLRKRIHHIEYVVTRNEYEALLLENNLIKEHQPRYNINLKDGKSYPVIRITAEEYPRVFKTRNMVQDGSEYFGPFTSVVKLERYLELIERLYPLRKCRGPVKPREHPCLYYHLGRCSAVCAGKTTKKEYLEHVEGIRRLLSGDTTGLLEDLEAKMNAAAGELLFEKAADYRDLLGAIRQISAEQQVVDFDESTRDYLAMAKEEDLAVFVVLQMRGGKMVGSDTFASPAIGEDAEDLEEFALQYYGQKSTLPSSLFLSLPDFAEEIGRYFAEERRIPVVVEAALSDRDVSILRLATENARYSLEKRLRERGNLPAVRELKRVLELPREPVRIEGFDIAHVGGSHTVAAMVSFLNGVPDKNNYRRFKIRSVQGKADDFESMREVVARRYTRVVNGEIPSPDLILIDGGKGQVSATTEILSALGLVDISVVGLAKREEEIFLPGAKEPVTLPEGSPPLRLLQHVRDEAHRFATTYRAAQHSKDLSFTVINSVPGIGPARAKRLVEAYESIESLAEAPPDEVSKRTGVPEEVARRLIDRLSEHLLGGAPQKKQVD
ncbi:MAG: excinuclease ABC subunit UvrC [Spirochaetaceae bacterium]